LPESAVIQTSLNRLIHHLKLFCSHFHSFIHSFTMTARICTNKRKNTNIVTYIKITCTLTAFCQHFVQWVLAVTYNNTTDWSIDWLTDWLIDWLTCTVCGSSQLSATSRRRVLRSRHALHSVTSALAEGPSQRRVGSATACPLPLLHPRSKISGL